MYLRFFGRIICKVAGSVSSYFSRLYAPFVVCSDDATGRRIIIEEHAEIKPRGVAMGRHTAFQADSLYIADKQGRWLCVRWEADELLTLSYEPKYDEVGVNKLFLWGIQQMASMDGLAFVHAMGFSRAGHAVVCPAWENTGKTRTLMHFVENGDRVIGDEWVVLGADGQVWGFPKAPLLFQADVRELPTKLTGYLRMRERLCARLERSDWSITGRIVRFTVKHAVGVKYPFVLELPHSSVVSVHEPVALKSIIYLVRSTQPQLTYEKVDQSALLLRLMSTYLYEHNAFLESRVWEYAFPEDSRLKSHYQRVQSVLKAVRPVQAMVVRIPWSANGRTISDFVRKILGGG